MTVKEIVAGNEHYEVTGAGYAPTGSILRNGRPVDPSTRLALRECLLAGLLCNDATLAEADAASLCMAIPPRERS